MSKELEALEKLGNIDVTYNNNGIEGCYSIKDREEFDIIKTALKDSENIKFLYEDLVRQYELELETKSKKEQAFEIIKEKKVQVGLLIHILNDENVIESSKTYQGNYFLYLYNSCCSELYGRLTEEEFDLLKEVLK